MITAVSACIVIAKLYGILCQLLHWLKMFAVVLCNLKIYHMIYYEKI